MTTRISREEKEHAIHTARNVKDSKFGECLLRNNIQNERQLSSQLRIIERDLRRLRIHKQQEMKQFVQTRHLPEPLLIVERPPSPKAVKKYHFGADENDSDKLIGISREPSYMRPLRSKTKTPSSLATIDAFTVKRRKKVNTWEDAMSVKTKPRFQTAVQPSYPLTPADIRELERGYSLHRPPSTGHLERTANTAPPSAKQRNYTRLPPETQISHTFITQLPPGGAPVLARTVSFAPESQKKNIDITIKENVYS